MLPNFKAVGPIETELHILKVEKLDVCIRPLFANLVTYINTCVFYGQSLVAIATWSRGTILGTSSSTGQSYCGLL